MTDWLGYNLLDFGNKYSVGGVVYNNSDEQIVIMLPGEEGSESVVWKYPTWEEWKTLLAQTDIANMEIVDEKTRAVKAIISRSARQINEVFRWGIFRRDNFTCQYCGVTEVPLTIDEYLCQHLGGPINEENCKTACRQCNKTKANKTPEEWEKYREEHGIHGPTN